MRHSQILLSCLAVLSCAGCSSETSYKSPPSFKTSLEAQRLERSDSSKAEELFKKAIQQAKEENEEPYAAASEVADLGKFYIHQARYTEAEKYLKEAIELEWQKMQKETEPADAAKAKVTAQVTSTDSPVGDNVENKTSESEKKLLEAEADLSSLKSGAQPALVSDLALCYDYEGRHKEAEELWSRAVHNFPGMYTGLEDEASRTNLAHNPQKALEFYKRAIKLRENAIETKNSRLACLHEYMGDIYAEIGQNDDAENEFKTALEIFKPLPVTDYLSAYERRTTMESYVRLLKKEFRTTDAAAFKADIDDLKSREEQYEHPERAGK